MRVRGSKPAQFGRPDMRLLRRTLFGLGVAFGVFLLTVPGLRRLPQAGRTTVDGVTTVDDAMTKASATGLDGWELVGFVQHLAARKFDYSRRNPWDTPARAFERGMGYCQQQALALREIYGRLGIEARPVHARSCHFPAGEVHGMPEPAGIRGHVWLRVRVDGEERDVCCGDEGNTPGNVHFTILSRVHELYPWLWPFTHLGSVLENVRRDWVARQRYARGS
ncbi:hypothetical protein [Agromyces sp. ZXT2-6]|uniref:hypothetical protein n=1 Tax=Agromyces sp. ZXT2-6 TaxID=3461153 RepID=UPI004054F93D